MRDFFDKENCDRCGKKLIARILSKMNEDIICIQCKEKEREHPDYAKADAAELAEVKKGNYNYKGLYSGKRLV